MKIMFTLSQDTVDVTHPNGSATIHRAHLAAWLRMLLRMRWKH